MTASNSVSGPTYAGAAAAIIVASIIPSISITPILPKMQADYADVSQVDVLVQLTFALPGLLSMFAAPVTGIISDRINRGTIVIFAAGLATILGILPFVLDSIWTIIASRAALGICQGALIVCTSALIADYFTDRKREKILGLKFGAVGVANILLFIAAGVVSENEWRNVFLLYLWGAAATALSLAYVRNPPVRPGKKFDVRLTNLPWKDLSAPYFGGFLGAASFTLLLGQLPFLLEARNISDSPAFAGLVTSLMSVGMLISAFAYPKIIQRITGMMLWFATFLVVAFGCLLLFVSGNVIGIMAGTIIVGLGCGSISPNSLNMVLAKVALEARGKAAGIQTTFFFFGIFAGPMLGVALMRATGSVAAIFAGWAVLCLGASAYFYSAMKGRPVAEQN